MLRSLGRGGLFGLFDLLTGALLREGFVARLHALWAHGNAGSRGLQVVGVGLTRGGGQGYPCVCVVLFYTTWYSTSALQYSTAQCNTPYNI